MILADTPTPNPGQFTLWLNTIVMILTGTAAGMAILRLNKSEKREVTFGFQPASKEEVDKQIDSAKKDIREIFQRLNPVEAAIEKNTAVTEMNTATLVRVEAQLTRMLERERR